MEENHQRQADEPSKFCTECLEEKLLTQFRFRSRDRDRRHYQCNVPRGGVWVAVDRIMGYAEASNDMAAIYREEAGDDTKDGRLEEQRAALARIRSCCQSVPTVHLS